MEFSTGSPNDNPKNLYFTSLSHRLDNLFVNHEPVCIVDTHIFGLPKHCCPIPKHYCR
jgi:hypothetical protein